MARIVRRFGRCRSGSTAIEFAIVGLLMVLMAFAVIDFGRALYVRHQVAYASDVASRMLLMNPGASSGAVESAVRAAFAGPDPERLQVTVVGSSVSGVDYRDFTVVFPLQLRIPGMTATILDLTVARRVPLL